MAHPASRNVTAALTFSALLLTASPVPAEEKTEDVQALSHGYALLHQTVERLDRLPKVLYLKLESDAVDALATEIGEHTSTALDEIEAYAQSHPGIDLADAGLPRIDRERRSRTTRALLKEMATTSGVEFERGFLLAMTNLLNQLRHTAAALAEMPQDAAGAQLAQRWRGRFEADYERVRRLLADDYFRPAKEGG